MKGNPAIGDMKIELRGNQFALSQWSALSPVYDGRSFKAAPVLGVLIPMGYEDGWVTVGCYPTLDVAKDAMSLVKSPIMVSA